MRHAGRTRYPAEPKKSINDVHCGQTPLSLAEGTSARGLLERVTPHRSTSELLGKLGAGSRPSGAPVGKCIEGRFGLEYTTVMPGDKDEVKGGGE
jgi:hypothetical protein